ncbi:hypothetical protein V8017_13140 [Stenotrophomonas rhizophila]
MAKQKPQPAPIGEPTAVAPGDAPSVEPATALDTAGEGSSPDPGVALVENPPNVAYGAADGGGEPDPSAATTVAPPAPEALETVRALVLSDGPFGRCGDVREFDAAHAADIEAGGFIDTHPNAVASAEGN